MSQDYRSHPETPDPPVTSDWSDEDIIREYRYLGFQVTDRYVMDEQIEGTRLYTEIQTLFAELAERDLEVGDI